jgi:hypothetical protein
MKRAVRLNNNKLFWFGQLQELDKELNMGLNFSMFNDRTSPMAKKPSLGSYPRYAAALEKVNLTLPKSAVAESRPVPAAIG